MHCVKWKMGYATTSNAKLSFKWKMQWFLYENLINTFPSKPSASTKQNATMQQCIMMQKANFFVFFELKWDNKEKVWPYNPQTLQPLFRQNPIK